MKPIFFSFISVFFVFTINATTYYVSEAGNNSHSGSQSNPWETLQYAADHVEPGDSVIVTAGEYTGFYMDISGEEDNPIVIRANEGAIINSRNETTDDGINLEGADYIVIEGFTVLNPSGNITRAGIRSVVNSGVVIKNNTIDGMGQWGIFTGFSENIIIKYNICSNSVDEHGIYHSNSADNPVIRGNVCFGNNDFITYSIIKQ